MSSSSNSRGYYNPSSYHSHGFGRGDRAFTSTAKTEQKFQERLQRALSQRLFVVETVDRGVEERTYTIYGSKGDIYTVVIGTNLSCTCPDASKGFNPHNCKHLLYCMVRCLGLALHSEQLRRKRFSKEEVREWLILARKVNRACIASEGIRKAFHDYKSGKSLIQIQRELESENVGASDVVAVVAEEKTMSGRRRDPLDDEELDCCVCYDSLTSKDNTTWCRLECGKNFHLQCIKAWLQHKKMKGEAESCPNCRASPWQFDVDNVANNASDDSREKISRDDTTGYLNLAFAATASASVAAAPVAATAAARASCTPCDDNVRCVVAPVAKPFTAAQRRNACRQATIEID